MKNYITNPYVKQIIKKIIKKIELTIQKLIFLIRVRIPKNEYFFVSPYGIGDTYIILSFLKEFQKSNPSNSIRLGLVKEAHLDFVRLFKLENIKIERYSKEHLIFCPRNIFKPGIPIVLHPSYFMSESLHSIIGFKGLTLIDVYKILLNLPINSKPDLNLDVNSTITLNAKNRFAAYGLPVGQTVLIAPNAYSINDKEITIVFWEKVISHLAGKGYIVAALTSDKDILNLGALQVDFPLSQTIPFLNLCHAFISIRSGLCELSGTANCKKIIVYPDIQFYSGKLIEGTSMIDMGLGVGPVHEIIVASDLDAEKINNLF